MPYTKRVRNLWPFGAIKRAVKRKARAMAGTTSKRAVKAEAARLGKARGIRSTQTVASAIAQARAAGAKTGSDGAFDNWLHQSGLSTRGNAVIARLRREFHKGVERGEAPAAPQKYKGSPYTRTGKSFGKGPETYQGYRLRQTEQGEWYSDLDRDSKYASKQEAKRAIDDYKAGRSGNPSGRAREYSADELARKFEQWDVPQRHIDILGEHVGKVRRMYGSDNVRILWQGEQRGGATPSTYFDDRRNRITFSIPFPQLADHLFAGLHEVGHAVLHNGSDKPKNLEEWEANEYAIDALRAAGVPLSEVDMEEWRRYVCGHVKDDRKRGAPIDPRAEAQCNPRRWRINQAKHLRTHLRQGLRDYDQLSGGIYKYTLGLPSTLAHHVLGSKNGGGMARNPGGYATSSVFGQARDYHNTPQEAEDHAQYMADEYGIPYHAWSVRSMEPSERGEYRWHITATPTPRRRGRRNPFLGTGAPTYRKTRYAYIVVRYDRSSTIGYSQDGTPIYEPRRTPVDAKADALRQGKELARSTGDKVEVYDPNTHRVLWESKSNPEEGSMDTAVETIPSEIPLFTSTWMGLPGVVPIVEFHSLKEAVAYAQAIKGIHPDVCLLTRKDEGSGAESTGVCLDAAIVRAADAQEAGAEFAEVDTDTQENPYGAMVIRDKHGNVIQKSRNLAGIRRAVREWPVDAIRLTKTAHGGRLFIRFKDYGGAVGGGKWDGATFDEEFADYTVLEDFVSRWRSVKGAPIERANPAGVDDAAMVERLRERLRTATGREAAEIRAQLKFYQHNLRLPSLADERADWRTSNPSHMVLRHTTTVKGKREAQRVLKALKLQEGYIRGGTKQRWGGGYDVYADFPDAEGFFPGDVEGMTREFRNPTEESVQDRSHREWIENAARVARDPQAASNRDLERAIGFLSHRQSHIQQAAWREGRTPNAAAIDSLDREMDWYRSILQSRGRRNPRGKMPTRTLTLAAPLGFVPVANKDGYREARPGEKLKVSWDSYTERGHAYMNTFDGMYHSTIPPDEGRAKFKNWPAEWVGTRDNPPRSWLTPRTDPVAEYYRLGNMALRSIPGSQIQKEWQRKRDAQQALLEREGLWPIRRRNPELLDTADAADHLYEDFHGTEPRDYVQIETQVIEPTHLTTLGTMVSIKVETVSGLAAEIGFDEDPPYLCSSPDGTQLYFEGGNQSLDLGKLKMSGDDWEKQAMVIGDLVETTYRTQKAFDKFQTIDYYHANGEEKGIPPQLLYDPINKLLSVAGGTYQVKPEGIVD